MHRHQAGESLIEFLIAMTLGLMLISILVMALQSVWVTGKYIQGTIEAQEAGRISYHLLSQDLKHADTKILDPTRIPLNLQKRFKKNSQGLFIQYGSNKIVYFLVEDAKTKLSQLHRKNLEKSSHNQDAMIQNLKTFNVHYGELIKGQLLFLPANNIKQWDHVIVLKVHLLTIADIGKKPISEKYTFILRVNTKQ